MDVIIGLRAGSLSETMVMPSLVMSVLSVPVLINKKNAVLFIPDRTLLINLEDYYKMLGTVANDADYLFYVVDNQKFARVQASTLQDKKTQAMMTIIRKQVPSIQSDVCEILIEAVRE